jgi:hypothetical protein
MKIRVRDQKLPLKAKTKKFKPLRFKYDFLKWSLGVLILSNLYFIYRLYF